MAGHMGSQSFIALRIWGGYEISQNVATILLSYLRNCYTFTRNFTVEYREMSRRNSTKFRETCQFGGLDPGHVPNQIGQD
jgi:hypothetical protein